MKRYFLLLLLLVAGVFSTRAQETYFTKADLEFVVSHAQAHGGCVGGWQDSESGQYYFDSVRIFPVDSLAQARQFGRENQQKAIYNLSTGKEIRLPVRRTR